MNSTIKSIDTVLIFTPVSISTSLASLGLLKKSNCLLILVFRELLFCSACSSLLCSAKDYLAEEADLLFAFDFRRFSFNFLLLQTKSASLKSKAAAFFSFLPLLDGILSFFFFSDKSVHGQQTSPSASCKKPS